VLKNDLLILSKYDFNTDVDVNILGHIFEHSLNEVDDVEAELVLPKVSVTVLAAIDGLRVPAPVTGVALKFQVILSVVVKVHVMPVAVPPVLRISPFVNVLGSTAAEKTTVKSIGAALTGSD
jgi:hypothetical protein